MNLQAVSLEAAAAAAAAAPAAAPLVSNAHYSDPRASWIQESN